MHQLWIPSSLLEMLKTIRMEEFSRHLVYTVHTNLLHTNRGLGGLLEIPHTPLKNVQIQGIAKTIKNSALNFSITTNLTKQLRRSSNLSSMLVCFLKFFTQNLVRLWCFKSNGAPRMVNIQDSKIFLRATHQFPLPILTVGST